MNYKIKLNQITTARFSVLAIFAVLILCSSCNTRKSILAALDLPVAQSLNVSKATLNDKGICFGLPETIASVNHDKKHQASAFDATFPQHNFSEIIYSAGNINVLLCSAQMPEAPTPLYLLYKKMKVLI